MASPSNSSAGVLYGKVPRSPSSSLVSALEMMKTPRRHVSVAASFLQLNFSTPHNAPMMSVKTLLVDDKMVVDATVVYCKLAALK